MPSLHIISRTEHQGDALRQCLRVAGTEDHFLLIEDGVYQALAASSPSSAWAEAAAAGRLSVLEADWAARGLTTQTPLDGTIMVGWGEVVALTEQYEKTCSWY